MAQKESALLSEVRKITAEARGVLATEVFESYVRRIKEIALTGAGKCCFNGATHPHTAELIDMFVSAGFRVEGSPYQTLWIHWAD